MDAQRRGSEMTDGALDGELRSILAANPSPEFVARVRVRIADEPRPASTWRYTTFAIAGVVAAVVVAAVLFGRDSGQRTPAPMPLVARAIGGVSALPERPRRSVARSTPQIPAYANAAAPSPNEPEVLIDPRERAALLAVVRGTRDGSLDLAPVVAASTPTAMELGPLVEITIPDISIDPIADSIAPAPGTEGVRQ